MASVLSDAVYGDRVVGFVDILGFANLVRQADRDVALRGDVVNALDRVRSVAPPSDGDTDLRAQNFSDSLILSAVNTPDGLWHLLLSITALGWNLLQLGVFIRGGVTVGGIHHSDRMVFGIGVNEAYRLESTVAKFPRVVLGANAIAAATNYSQQHETWSTYCQSRLLRDRDGVWFLNYLVELGSFNGQDPNNPDMVRHPLCTVGRSIRDLLQEKIDGTVDQPDIYAKLAWFVRYWNAEVATHPDAAKTPVIGRVLLPGDVPRQSPLPFRTY